MRGPQVAMKQNKFRWKRVLPDRSFALSHLFSSGELAGTHLAELRVGGAGAREQRVSLDFMLGPVGCVLRVSGVRSWVRASTGIGFFCAGV